MFKILIADMDNSTVEMITEIVASDIKDAQIVGVSDSGADAVIQTINTEPDLLIVSLRMAGLNGMEMIRQVRGFNKTVRIIIVSAYDYFSFAREAMLLGVNDYLLKPLNRQKTCESILREQKNHIREMKRLQKFHKEEENYGKAMRFVENAFLYSLICDANFASEAKAFQEILQFGDYGYVMSLSISSIFVNQYRRVERITERICQIIKEVVGQTAKCAIGPNIMNLFMIYVDSGEGKETKKLQADSVRMAKQIEKSLKEDMGLETFIAIGTVKTIELANESYQEALICAKYKKESPIVHYKEVAYRDQVLVNSDANVGKLLEMIKYNEAEMNEMFSKIIHSFRALPNDERVSRIVEVLCIVQYEFSREQNRPMRNFDYFAQCKALEKYPVEEQEVWAASFFNSIVNSVQKNKIERKANIINVAIEYLTQHYNEDITLNEIAQYVNLSPQHFSKIFKETTNLNFVEWVNTLRISKAKELMNRSDRTIKEICYQVGYQDPNYFSRIFKKYVGISPTEYMKERAD